MMAGNATYGAGEAMGLEVMLFADKESYFLTSAFFEGFKVYVHRPDEFPLVRDRGLALGTGQEMFGTPRRGSCSWQLLS